MNKKQFMLFFLFSGFICCQASDSDAFAQAVAQCKAGNYQEGVELFLQLAPSADNFLNIASCYFANQDYQQALLFVKRAEKLAGPIQRLKVLRALRQVKKALQKPLPTPVTIGQKINYFWTILLYLLCGVGLIWLELLMLGFWLLLLLAIKRHWRGWLKGLLGAGLITVFMLTWWLIRYQNTTEAIINKPDIVLYSGPGTDFISVGQVGMSSVVKVVQNATVDGFIKISDVKNCGWISKEDADLI